MKTKFHTTEEIIEDYRDSLECPIDLAIIPNTMGINLVAVEGVSWTRQADGQLVSVTIHFIPDGS